nr:satratoxin biosynthesis SC1 cluster protein 4-like [Quercus suber]
MGTIKLAILLQILRVFVPNRHVNYALFVGCWITIGFVVIFYTLDFCLELAQCTPREKIWNPFVQGGSCVQVPALYEATGIFNVISDFAILLLPLPTIYKLQCGWKKKIAIGGVFATGFFVCIISILRTYYTWRLFTETDVSWEISFLGFWTWAELCVGTLVFCLPILPKFFHVVKDTAYSYMLSRLWTSRQDSSVATAEGLEDEDLPAQGKQQSKQMYPHMIVSLASWEQPEPGETSSRHLGPGMSVTRSVTMTEEDIGPVSRADSSAQAHGLPIKEVEQV